jgi:YVTN family beta-propeller protein/uncharacterized repeat protein (TIGR03803 family)
MNGAMQNRNRIPGIVWWTPATALALTIMLAMAVFASGSAQAQDFNTIASFNGANGFLPYAGLVQGTDGNFYGTTYLGGSGSLCPDTTDGCGTVFKTTPGGMLTSLYSFCQQSGCADGEYPQAGLVQGTDGNFYGTTTSGGANGVGTVFKITPGGMLTPFYSFCQQSGCTDGADPQAGLVQGTDGNFYGTTASGGAQGSGTIFKITSGGMLTPLYSFCQQANCTDGADPYAGLTQGPDGSFYGTTLEGGAGGAGTVFSITPTGSSLATLHSFCLQTACADGESPFAGLVYGADGKLYGTTHLGGAGSVGTVFSITPTGSSLVTLHSFCSQANCTDGELPYAGLIQASDGNFYGTTLIGTVFSITPVGSLTTLYTFCAQGDCTDGADSYAGLIQANDGSFYGTTLLGGTNTSCESEIGIGCGTVFRLQLGTTNQTTTTISSSPNPSAVSQSVTFTATVTSPSSGTITGTVNFTYASTTLCSAVVLTGGMAACTYSALPAGSDLVVASYSGNASFAPSSGNVTQAVTQAGQSTTTTTVTSSANPSTFNQQITFTATVVGQSGGAPTGTVTFGDGVTTLGSSTLSGGTATLSIATLAVGPHPITAVYSGDTNFVGSSGSLNQTVNKASTAVALLSSVNPSALNQPVTFTATITPQNGGQVTGTVTFKDGSTTLDVATVSGNVASFTTGSLANGTHSITAFYSGDSNFPGSTSNLLQQVVGSVNQVPGPFAYVANINDNTVSVINIPTSTVVNTIPVGSGPWGVAVSPNQTQVYVTNNHGNNVSVIDTTSSTVVATIPLQSSPFGVAFTPDGLSAYVVNGSSDSVSVINTASQAVVATVPVESGPVGVAMAVTSNGTFAYVTNSASNSVSVIAVASNTVLTTIPVGSGPRWVAVAPNSSLAYVENAGSNNVSVISIATNTVTATIPVGTSPFGAAFTPDGSFAYVVNSGSDTVSVIETKSGTVSATVTGFDNPVHVALSTDGASAYVTNLNANDVSVISTASNTITGTVAVGSGPIGIAIASAPPTQLQIKQPLSPTQPNVFNFGAYQQAVQYPPDTSFSGVNMTTTAVEITPAAFQKRVAHTEFANAACIVYSGTGGNCVDFQVTCSDNSGNPMVCPADAQPDIAIQTGFTTSQAIVNPGYLTTPLGKNEWINIFTEYADPTVKGKTSGFSEFVAVSRGATNPQGLAQFKLVSPVFPKTIVRPHDINLIIRLTSAANGMPISDAKVSLSVVMIADAHGNPTQQLILSRRNVFKETGNGARYEYVLHAAKYAAGTYTLTIYGNAFPAYQGQFTIVRKQD